MVKLAVEKDPYALELASVCLQNDPEIALPGVECDGSLFQHASDRLRNDPKFIKQAVQKSPYAFEFASRDALLADDDMVEELVLLYPEALRTSELVTKEIALKVVGRNGLNLIYLSEAFQADREIVLEAVKHYSIALEYGSKTLQPDREFVLEAAKHSGLALRGAYAFRSRQARLDGALALPRSI